MELYKTVKENLLREVETLSRKHSLSLFDKIKKENNKRNLEALLTEAHFGLYFDSISDSLRYNHAIGGLTPDFAFTKNEQEVLVEIARVNPVQKDMDIEEEVNNKIDAFRESNPNDKIISSPQSITWKPDRLVGQRGSIAKKAERYKDLVAELNKPFIICVYVAFISGLDRLDLSHGLYGSLAELTGEFEGLGYAFNSPFRVLDGALYYNNVNVRKTVSGVLLKDHDGSFVFFQNFSGVNKLNQENRRFFAGIQGSTAD